MGEVVAFRIAMLQERLASLRQDLSAAADQGFQILAAKLLLFHAELNGSDGIGRMDDAMFAL